MNTMEIRANVKINLGLRVKFRRKEGFCEIESIFQELNFGHEIVLQPDRRN